jgi:hypothetical protein
MGEELEGEGESGVSTHPAYSREPLPVVTSFSYVLLSVGIEGIMGLNKQRFEFKNIVYRGGPSI